MGSLFSCGNELLFDMTEDEFALNGGGIAFLDARSMEITPITKIYQKGHGVALKRGNLIFPCGPGLLVGI